MMKINSHCIVLKIITVVIGGDLELSVFLYGKVDLFVCLKKKMLFPVKRKFLKHGHNGLLSICRLKVY